jgi:hypothetical protein
LILHFYHVYADGRWEIPLTEHLEALHGSGLYPQLDKFYVGIVGSEDNIAAVKAALDGVECSIIAEAPVGWEHETMRHIPRLLGDDDAHVLYCHTKSASDQSEINVTWRRSMTFFNVVEWRQAIPRLETHDAYGCHVLPKENGNCFGGNFWWATADFLRSLPPLLENDRWDAERWLGRTDTGKFFDANPGWPAVNLFTTRWTYN